MLGSFILKSKETTYLLKLFNSGVFFVDPAIDLKILSSLVERELNNVKNNRSPVEAEIKFLTEYLKMLKLKIAVQDDIKEGGKQNDFDGKPDDRETIKS